MDDLIEIGVEALNPIQVSAAGMNDTKKMKEDFGDRLTFWGAIDTHHVLPQGTDAERAWCAALAEGSLQQNWADLRWADRIVIGGGS